jgi:hypothetical protein
MITVGSGFQRIAAKSANRTSAAFSLNFMIFGRVSVALTKVNQPIPRFVSAFFSHYPGRILYGTDMTPDAGMYRETFRILETADEHFYLTHFHNYHWPLYGLDLPEPLLKNIYRENALRIALPK